LAIFDSLEYAKEELVPMVRAITHLAEEAGQTDQFDFFQSILVGLDRASDSDDLADPLMALSMVAFLGFEMTSALTLLLDQLLDKAHKLTAALASEPEELH
jgi:hypothetical protein